MRVLFLGKIAELAGPERALDLPEGATVADAAARLSAEHAALGALLSAPSTVYILDDAVAKADACLDGARELAFLPPVSGG